MKRPRFRSVLIALCLVVVAGFAALAAARWYLQTPGGQDLVKKAELAADQPEAPGARELRMLGCEQTVIATLDELVEASRARFSDSARDRIAASDLGDTAVVICQNLVGAEVDCGEIAMLQHPHVRSGRGFLVLGQRGKSVFCSGVHARDGSRLGPIDFDSLPRLLGPSSE